MKLDKISKLEYGKPRISVCRYWIQKVFHSYTPPVLCNSFPKSGTHLLLGILSHVSPFSYYGRRVFWDKLTQTRVNPEKRSDIPDAKERLLSALPGEIVLAHLEAHPDVQEVLVQNNFKHFFIYRDLRDVVVSLFFMWKNGKGADMWPRRYFFSLNSDDERLAFLISGWGRDKLPEDIPLTVNFPHVGKRFMGNMNWLSDPNSLCLKYEDLLSQDRSEHTLHRMAKFLLRTDQPKIIKSAVYKMKKGFDPSRSRTYRKGKTGEWRRYFTAEHIKLFKDYAGDTLIELGYEKDLDW